MMDLLLPILSLAIVSQAYVVLPHGRVLGVQTRRHLSNAGDSCGPLNGVNVEESTNTLKLKMDDVDWLKKQGLAWEAATKDAEALGLTPDT